MRTAHTLALLALAAGCGIENNPIGTPPDVSHASPAPPGEVSNTDVIVQVAVPKVDVLFTIDNSGSMQREQDLLTEHFPSFIGYFTGSGLDYHVGVISTDMDDRSHSGKLRSAGGNKWIQSDTPNPEGVFTAMANMGTRGSGSERPIAAIYTALETLRHTFNDGYYRDEAAIHTIVVSDEDDSTPNGFITLPEFIGWYDGLKPEDDSRSFSGIVSSRNGQQFADVHGEIGGVLFDIKDENWDLVLDRLGVQASGLKREYFLSQLPVDDTIDVTVEETLPDGNILEHRFEQGEANPPSGDWYYDEGRNSITFHVYVPNALSRVKLSYDLLSATQEDDGSTEEFAD